MFSLGRDSDILQNLPPISNQPLQHPRMLGGVDAVAPGDPYWPS